MSIELHNPHAVLATLKQRPDAVLSLQVPRTKLEPAWRDVLALADSLGIRATTAEPTSKPTRKQSGQRESAALAIVREKPFTPIDEAWAMLANVKTSLCLALDQIQDPHNLGAILRSASFFGVQAVFFTSDRAAPLTSTVYDVSAGGVEYLPIVEVRNLARLFEQAKERGLWILGTSEHVPQPLNEVTLDRNWMLVVGNEQHGLRRLTLDLCDQVVSIPAQGGVTSLNVSVATGVLLAHIARESPVAEP